MFADNQLAAEDLLSQVREAGPTRRRVRPAAPWTKPLPPAALCCDSDQACVFAKALLSHTAVCELAQRRAVAERVLVECPSPVARTNCGTLAALLHERARFALRLPPPGRPLIHMQALRLQCGGLTALQQVLDAPSATCTAWSAPRTSATAA